MRNSPARSILRRLLAYFDGYRSRMLWIAACVVVSTLLGLLGPYLIGVALDRFVSNRERDGLLLIAALMLLAYLLKHVLDASSGWLMAGVSQKAVQALRQDVFAHILRLPIAFFERRTAGEWMSRLTNDIDAINQGLAQTVLALFACVLSMTGVLLAMLALDARMALATLVIVPLLLFVTRLIAVHTASSFVVLQSELGQLNATLEESISSQKLISAFRRNAQVMKGFRSENERVYSASVRANSYALLLMPLATVLGNLFVIVFAVLGGFLSVRGALSVGVIASFLHYAQSFMHPLRQITNLYNAFQAALAGAQRVFEVLDSPCELERVGETRRLTQVQGRVRFDQVRFGYRSDQLVIDGLSLEAKPGQLVALVGPTGAGKTTVTQLLMRFYDVESGAITIDDVDLRDLPRAALRGLLGVVLQETYLFGTTVLENIRYGRLAASDEEVVRAACLADADTFIRQLPDGYHTILSERASNLSQGQRQLLAIARTMLAAPAILILDEATSSVDTRTESKVQRSLARLMQGRTSFVIAHRLATIRDADQVLVIDRGQIIEQGTHDDLLVRGGLYRHMYLSQFGGAAL